MTDTVQLWKQTPGMCEEIPVLDIYIPENKTTDIAVVIMPGGGYFKKEILAGVKSGLISEKDVRRCCANVVKSIFDSAIQKEFIG